MAKLILIFFALFSLNEAQALTPSYSKTPACTEAFQKFQNRFTQLEKKYAQLDQQTVSEENKPTWTWGRKKQAVYLLHGFIGTPEEMSAVANKLIEQNYTVINDIIPGHGTNGFIANQFNQKTWVKQVEANLNSIRTCFDDIHLVGFSTGGLLIHDYLRHHETDFQARSLTLYSPFYKAHAAFAELLRSAARVLTPVILTAPLYYLTHFPDIKVAVLKPNNYLQQLPLDTAKYVEELGSQVNSDIHQRPLQNNPTPILLFVSDSDQIMNLPATLENIKIDFTDLKIVRFNKVYAPHHLMVNAVSPVATKVQDKSVEFILQNSN